MIAWVIKSKEGYLQTEDEDDYVELQDAIMFKLKEDAERVLKEGLYYAKHPETLQKIEIKIKGDE